MTKRRIMIIAGEPSGDLHGAGVVRELKKCDPQIDIYGIGGEKMQKEGMELVYHIRELAIMGFFEVIQHLPLLKSIEHTLCALLKNRKPDVVLLIDYPGFNLRFAKIARKYKTKIVYYISPQIWAWHPGRIKNMKYSIDKMLVVFPFEVEIYKKHNIDVEFVGHPILEILEEPQSRSQFCKQYNLSPDKLILGLFPGSRRQEIEKIFPPMLGAARLLHKQLDVQVVVGVASALSLDYVQSFLRHDFPVLLVQDKVHDLMGNTDTAIATSGTITLELAWYQVPMVIVYKTSLLSYLTGRMLIRIKHIGLVNIICGKQIVPECVQWAVNPNRLADEASIMLKNEHIRQKISEDLQKVKHELGNKGASKRVASIILDFVK